MTQLEPLDARATFRLGVLTEGGLLLAGVALGWFLERPPLEQIRPSVVGVGWGLLATLPMFAALGLMIRYPVGPLKPLAELVDSVLLPLFCECSLAQLAIISALAGLGEEVLFRGAIQGGIEQFSGSRLLALLLASALFGLAHPLTRLYVVLAGLIGVYLGWLWLATDNLLVPIVTHGVYDFVALLYLTGRRPAALAALPPNTAAALPPPVVESAPTTPTTRTTPTTPSASSDSAAPDAPA